MAKAHVTTHVLSEAYSGVRKCSDDLSSVHVVYVVCTSHTHIHVVNNHFL